MRRINRLIRATSLATMLAGLAVGLAAADAPTVVVPAAELRARIQEVLYWEAVCSPRQPVLMGDGALRCRDPLPGWVPTSQQPWFDDMLRWLDAHD